MIRTTDGRNCDEIATTPSSIDDHDKDKTKDGELVLGQAVRYRDSVLAWSNGRPRSSPSKYIPLLSARMTYASGSPSFNGVNHPSESPGPRRLSVSGRN